MKEAENHSAAASARERLRSVGALVAARGVVWLPGPILFFSRLSSLHALPRPSAWYDISISLRYVHSALSLLLALLAIAVGLGLVAGSKRSRSVALPVLWAMLISEALLVVGLVVPDFFLLTPVSGHWLPTMTSLGMTVREALSDIGWAAVLIIFIKRQLHTDPCARPRGRVAPMIGLVALLLLFREGMGLITAPVILSSLLASAGAGRWLTIVSVVQWASVAAPILAILCAISIPVLPRLTRTLAFCTLGVALLRPALQYMLLEPSSAMSTLTIASIYYVPAAMVVEYAVMIWVLLQAKGAPQYPLSENDSS